MKTFHVAPDKTLVEINQSEKVSIQCLKNHHIKDAIKNERSIIGTYMLPEEVDKYFDRTKPKNKIMKEEILKTLKKLNLTPELLTELEKLTPELEKIVNDGQEIFKLKVETDLRKELDVDKLKEQLETVKDMSKKNIAKLGQLDKIGITPNQAKDKEPEELFKLASENLTKILEDNKTQTDETVKKELNEYKEKYANALKKQEDKEKEFKTQLEQTISGYEQKEYFGKVKEKVLNIADKFTFITTDESGIKKIKETEIKDFPNEFKVDLATDTVTRPDGSPYIVDDKIVIKTLDEAVKYKFSGWTAKAGIGSEGEGKKKEDEKPGFEKPSGNTLASLIEKDKAYVSE